jgi:hypothetical protein
MKLAGLRFTLANYAFEIFKPVLYFLRFSLALILSPAWVVVLPIKLMIVSQLTKGQPRQF